jgi:hypothetical protein
MSDPDNPQNHCAGNGDDLVKHSVYGVTLDTLLQRDPWRDGSCVLECHAGRGVYHMPAGERRNLVERLHQDGGGLLLADAQRDALRALDVDRTRASQWYAGSTVQVSMRLASHGAAHRHIAYEWHPDTRKVLAGCLAHVVDAALVTEVVGSADERRLDGETAIAERIDSTGPGDVVLLDPFALWRHAKHAERRSRYRRLFEALVARGEQAPALLMFWTWGRDLASANGDLEGSSQPVGDGYAELRALLAQSPRPLAILRWRWDLACVMWLWLPAPVATEVCARIEVELSRLRARVGDGERPRWELDVAGARAMIGAHG